MEIASLSEVSVSLTEVSVALTVEIARLEMQTLRRALPGVTIPEIGDLEEISMLEHNMDLWRERTQRGRQEGVSSLEELGSLTKRILTAETLGDMGLG